MVKSAMFNNRLDFDTIVLEEIPNIAPTLEELSFPNDINSFINKPEIHKLGMKYGMLKITTPPNFQKLLRNNLANKQDDLKFKIRVREQNLNELELYNRSNKFFEHQLKAFNSIIVEEEVNIPKSVVTLDGKEFTPYDIYVEILKAYNSEDIDSEGRYVNRLPKKKKKSAQHKANNIKGNFTSAKRRKSSRLNEKLKQTPDDDKNTLETSSKDEWEIPDPKNALFLQNPNKKHTSLSSDSVKFWKSLSEDYETLYEFYADYLRHYMMAIFKYDGVKPWSAKRNFKSNGISIIHHMPTEGYGSLKEEETEDGDLDDSSELCRKCSKNKKLYQCSYCQELYHKSCIPTLVGRFGKLCDNCLLGNFEYGFEELQDTITIGEFRKKYANKKKQSIKDSNSLLKAEKQFWEIVYGDRLVKSYYGADIHNDQKDYISGFENQSSDEISKSFLNLMNLPNDKNTLLPLLNGITGISLPWCYFGSEFSLFGIHLEDHFTYSINYQFVGDSKIWYSIKIEDSDRFREYIASKYPDFLNRQKDILHQLTATISPYDKHLHETMGVTFYKAVQNPGDYIITFPKCWHFGFNLGFNHNEAVNFILPNWIPFAIEADKVYKKDGRKFVFDIYKLIQKNIAVNMNFLYSNIFFEHVDAIIKELNISVEIILRETLMRDYENLELDLSDFADSFMINEISCDLCKKICSFSMVLTFNDTELYDSRFLLGLKQILINSKKLNSSQDNEDYENLNNMIASDSNDADKQKKIGLYCTACYNEHHKEIKNYLLTQVYYLKDSLNSSHIFRKDEHFHFPIGFQ